MNYKVTDHTGENVLNEEELIEWEKFIRQQGNSYTVKNDDGYEYSVVKDAS